MRRSSWVLMLAVALLAGCSSAAAPTPQIVFVTPEPTAAPSPTAEPTARPTPTPVPTPVAIPTEDPDKVVYAAFLQRVLSANTELEGLYEDMSNGAATYDADTILASTSAMSDFATTELSWLERNAPAECYAEAHSKWASVLRAFQKAADLFSEWASAYPDGADTVTSGLRYVDLGVKAWGEAGDALTSTTCDQ